MTWWAMARKVSGSSTFHSTCVRILRRFIDHLGYGTNFTIYDTDDQKTIDEGYLQASGD